MRKYLITSCVYMGLGLAFGVFFREFTKACGFTDTSALGKLHLHALALGMMFFLIVAFTQDKFNLKRSKLEKWFYIPYNVGLGMTLVMLLVRGIIEVKGYTVSSGAISGVAGIGHMLLAAGLVIFFVIVLKNCKSTKNAETAQTTETKE